MTSLKMLDIRDIIKIEQHMKVSYLSTLATLDFHQIFWITYDVRDNIDIIFER